MIKSPKVKRMIEQNGIEIQNFTMVIRLKRIIEQLNQKIQSQQQIIMSLKRDTKTTKINQMEVQIQHLNDQNKRLTLMIQQQKYKYKQQISHYRKLLNNIKNNTLNDQNQYLTSIVQKKFRKNGRKSSKKFEIGYLSSKSTLSTVHYHSNSSLVSSSMGGSNTNNPILLNSSSKKTYQQMQRQKQQLMKQRQKQRKFEKKYYQILQQTQKLKKELINYKIFDCSNSLIRKRNSNQHDRSSILFIKNMQNIQKITQKKHDLEIQNQILKKKLLQNQNKLNQCQNQNQKIKSQLNKLQSEIEYLILQNNQLTSDNNVKTLSKIINEEGNLNNISSQYDHKNDETDNLDNNQIDNYENTFNFTC